MKINLHIRHIVIGLIFFGMGCISSNAMKPYIPKIVNPLSESWRWKHFSELEGKGVRDIAEASDGTVWIGVDDGVFEYDGYEWKLHKNNENGLTDAPIQQVYISKNGSIYAASNQQIFQYDGATWHSVLNSALNYNFNFSKIIELADESIMLSSADGILHLQNSGKHFFYAASNRIEHLKAQQLDFEWIRIPEAILEGENFWNVSDILQEKSGKIWMAFTFKEKGKLLRFYPLKTPAPYITDYEYFTSNKSIQLGEEQKLIETKENQIWVTNSSFKSPINIFSNEKWQPLFLSEKFGGDEYTNDIVQTNDGTIWIGALGKLYAFNNEKWTLYDTPNYKIPANKLQLYKSKENKLWISGLMSKVYLVDYSSDRWVTYEGLNFQCETTPQEQWFLDVDGNAISKNGNRWIAWGVEDGFIDAPVRIIVTKKGQIWAAGSHNGVAATVYFKNEKWHKQLHPTLSWGIDYRAVFEAADGSIWFGGSVDAEYEKGQFSGVLQLTNPQASSFNWLHHKYNENGLKQSNSYGIGQTPDGTIWMGGSNLSFYDGEKWDRLTNERLRQFVNIVASTESQLIAGSRYYGIFIYDGKTWKNYNSESGLTNNTIISIDAISNDNIWVATENDICHFDGHRWQNNMFPHEMNMDFEGGDIKHSSDGSVWINRSDRGWKRRAFSHSKSQQNIYNNFITYKYIPDQLPPETKITFFSEEVSTDGNTMIQWEGKDFFEETPNENLSYSYRLNNGEWSSFSREKHHTFLSLSNGQYRLEVRAMDLGSNIDQSPAIVEFMVKSPVWKQAWFIALVGSFIFIILVFGYNIFTKNNRLEKLNSSLQKVNEKLKLKGEKIKSQNEEILIQQDLILKQKKSLETSNENLENQNYKIQNQRDKLELMVNQVEELSKAKLSFFTNISHELRTPLSLILGPINQLKNPNNTLSENEKINLYEIVERNATRLLKLINQLLEIRQIENSSMGLKLKEVNMKDFLFKITDLFQNLSKKRKIPLQYNSSVNNLVSRVDTDKVEKIVVNLLANAFKHTPDEGSIKLSLSEVDSKVYNLPLLHDNYFLIQVKDTGKGISPDVMGHIFDRYFSKKSLNQNEESSGIGLSYIKDLVEIHQGVIRVKSKLGEGSQFDVYLPLIQKEKPFLLEGYSTVDYEYAQREVESAIAEINIELIAVSSTNSDSSELPKILIVEDNTDMMSFLKGLLQKKYQIISAKNGKEALDLAQKHSIDLILSDVMMPEMNGLEFCNYIKTNFNTSHLPVILLTAKSLDEHQLEGYELGADDYITKPFNPQILELKIANTLKQRDAFQIKITRDFQISPKEIHLTSPDEEMLQKLVKLMESNINNSNFNVNSMCQSVNLSHMHFIRKVKQLTGKRPIDLLKSFRMKRAKDLLLQDKMTISEVAYSVGFEMPSSFSRAFKKEFGKSPTAFLEEG
ncbi:MAG: response regulator [Saprospiraceae bacterium]